METLTIPAQNKAPLVNIDVFRTSSGLALRVQLSPVIEDFFKHWGGGVQEPLDPYTRRGWPPVDIGEDGKPRKLYVWSFLAEDRPDQSPSYTLTAVGAPLLNVETDREYGPAPVNLSFLRLVGTQEAPITFGIKTLVCKGEVERIAKRINRALQDFYQDYFNEDVHHISTVMSTKF